MKLDVEPSSIAGVNEFYARVISDSLKPYLMAFAEMEVSMTEYGTTHKSTNVWNDADNK